MNDNAAAITLIVRTVGRASVHAALASIDAQGRSDIEIVVVDAKGGLSLALQSSCPLRVVGTGQAMARTRAANVGLAAAGTRWAMFLDDDDVLLPGHLDKLLLALQSADDAVLAHTGVELLRERDGQVETSIFDSAFEPWELLLGNRMPIHAALFDARMAKAHGVSFDESLDVYEDWDFWLQLRCLGRFAHVGGVTARYVVGAESSEVHRLKHGDAAYWRIWHKWWSRAPQAWWTEAFKAGVEMAGTSHQLRGTEQQLSDANSQLRSTWQALTATQAELAARVAEVAARVSEIAVLRQELVSAQAARQAIEHERDAAQHALVASRMAHSRTSEQLQAVQQSTSWRITRPLRASVDALRELRSSAATWRRNSVWRQWFTWGRRDARYQRWIDEVETVEAAQRRRELAPRTAQPTPLISVVMPVFNPDLRHLDEAIESVQLQTWSQWQLCIADDASTMPGVRERLREWAVREPRIRLVERASNGHISAASNSALALAEGEWIVTLDQDDVLAPLALAEVVDALDRHPDCGMIYSDEDKLDARGRRFEAHRKADFQMDLLHGHNFINHLVAYGRQNVIDLGGWREGFEGAQDHDLTLRVAETLHASQVLRIPRVLYHWRAGSTSTAGNARSKPYVADAALRAVGESLARIGEGGQVEVIAGTALMRVRHPLTHDLPEVQVRPADGDATPVTAPLVLVLREGLTAPQPAALDELMAQVMRKDVGVAAPCVRNARGELVEGGLVLAAAGQMHTAWAGIAAGTSGHFGRPALVQSFSAVTPSCMLMRASLWPLWHSTAAPTPVERARRFGERAAAAGYRLMWTPHAIVIDAESAADTRPMHAANAKTTNLGQPDA